MAVSAEIIVDITANDGTRDVQRLRAELTMNSVLGGSGKRESITLAAAFNALSPPVGASFVVIRWEGGTGSLTLKGVTGDTGITLGVLDETSPPIVLPISLPSIGILATAITGVEVLWL